MSWHTASVIVRIMAGSGAVVVGAIALQSAMRLVGVL
jgi:hypothetical protein